MITKASCITLACATAAAFAVALRAEVRCPAILGDRMVLQREVPVAIWGTAEAGEHVTVSFAGFETAAVADAAGRWRAMLPPLPASSEPRRMSIRGSNTLTFDDVLVGEVWLCSGQSNMEKPLGPRAGQKPTDDSDTEIAAADHPVLRLYHVPHHGRPSEKSVGLQWVACSPETIVATQFSAVGYFFGRKLLHELDVPIGLIHASFGGTMIEAWIPPAGFEGTPAIAALRERRYFSWVEGVGPTELYEAMIAPLAPYTLRGFLWYQGEANCVDGDGAIYAAKLGTLIESWRTIWHHAEAPFFYAQLAPFNYSAWDKFPKLLTPEALPFFWETQARALALPGTGMIVTTDLAGNARDIHPTNKRDIGLRFAGLALARTYKRTTTPACEFAQFASAEFRDDGTVVVSFKNTGGSLRIRDPSLPSITDFTLSGRDKHFVRADARIDGETVVVSQSSIRKPVAVRFGWHETANPNLVNAAGLPVMPFRTDSWPVIIERPRPSPTETTQARP